jgi:hypothetical protein
MAILKAIRPQYVHAGASLVEESADEPSLPA